MSPVMLVIAFHFNTLNFNQTCFPGRTVDSPCTLFTLFLLIEVSSILLANATNLHSLQTSYWSPISSITEMIALLTGRGIFSATRLFVASLVCILPRDVCQPKHKQYCKYCTNNYY